MQGQIVKFHDDIDVGIIVAENGRKFRFKKSEVVNLNGKLVGHDVDFVADKTAPKDIILMTGSPWSVFANTNGSKRD